MARGLEIGRSAQIGASKALATARDGDENDLGIDSRCDTGDEEGTMAETWIQVVERARRHEALIRAWLRLKTYVIWERVKAEALRRLRQREGAA